MSGNWSSWCSKCGVLFIEQYSEDAAKRQVELHRLNDNCEPNPKAFEWMRKMYYWYKNNGFNVG